VLRPDAGAGHQPAVERRSVVGQHGPLVVAVEVIDDPHLPDGEPGREQQPKYLGQARGGGQVDDQLALMGGVVEAPVAESEQP
jgi:hypothetical protein